MNEFLKDALFTALGYTIGRNLSKEDIDSVVQEYLKTVDVRTCIEDLARAKEVYVYDDDFYRDVVAAVEQYKDPYPY